MIDAVETLVKFESPSSDKKLLDLLADHLQERFGKLATDLVVFQQKEYGNQIKVMFGSNEKNKSKDPVIILCHYDTVWAEGTLKERPFQIKNGQAFGPGALDMKGGIILVEYAFRAIQELDIQLPRPVILLLTGDEEIGSITSRSIIEDVAKGASRALIPEAPLPGGVLKTARKGGARFVLNIKGKAAHSGVEPEKGISAVTELAHQILKINLLCDLEKGTTLNVGVVEGGTKTNVIPPFAKADIDVRVWTESEEKRITNAFSNLEPVNPKVKINVTGGFTRPPMERTEGIAKLFEFAKNIANQIDLDLKEAPTGGGSDGNFTAALGIPTLDGLGVVGDGVHADHEHFIVDSLPQRAALLTSLILAE